MFRCKRASTYAAQQDVTPWKHVAIPRNAVLAKMLRDLGEEVMSICRTGERSMIGERGHK
jgi:hypothetical protein